MTGHAEVLIHILGHGIGCEVGVHIESEYVWWFNKT